MLTNLERSNESPGDLVPLNADDCWQAVLHRDSRVDGRFVFAVRSTSIYCRPSCPARRPQRDRVVFYRSPEEAERDGFRPCLRCQPRGAAFQVIQVERACRYIEQHLNERLRLATLAERAGWSPSHLQRVFKRIMGISPREYAEAVRMKQLKAHLGAGESVTAAMLEAGFGSTSRMYEKTPLQLGMQPKRYRQKGNGIKIKYAVVECSLGFLLLAATENGICSIRLGDSEEELISSLEWEYSAAALQPHDGELREWASIVVNHMDGDPAALDLPLDIQATAFQRRVWQRLREIPWGSTRTYADIAKELGAPKAARAVGSACATNPAALLIPCHRVVRGDGKLGGYRWGLHRKQALLEREKRSKNQ